MKKIKGRNPRFAHTKRTAKQKESQARPLHTPGPWEIDPTGDIGPWIVGTSEKFIADCLGEFVTREEAQANARLIAAAPDLLKATQLQILNFQRQDNGDTFLGDDDHEAWTALANAVKKATSVPSGGNV